VVVGWTGSPICGIAQTQEMFDFCARARNEAFEQMG
jgi:hypothetical protein